MEKADDRNLHSLEVQQFIQENLKSDLQKLILKGSPFPAVSIQEIATQIEGKNKAYKKLPKWFNTYGVLYPPKINLEQASSELTSHYKASLIRKGSLIDMTGGFGVDDMAFADVCKKVYHCEKNESLSAIVKHNSDVFGYKNIEFITGDSREFLKSLTSVDIIYVDPSRRLNGGRVFLFEDCEPDIINNLPLYFQKADQIIIKAAPMLDISAAVKLLNAVSEVHIVSVNNECKELLFILNKGTAKAVKYVCAMLSNDGAKTLEFDNDEEQTSIVAAHPPENYLYEPDAAILKAGFFKSICAKFKVNKLHQHSHLYTSVDQVTDFPGKTFKIIQVIDFNKFTKSKLLRKANVATRNFNLKPEEIKKKFKINDGGDEYLYFTTGWRNNQIVINAKRI